MQKKLFGIILVDFDASGQLLIVYILHMSNTFEKMGTQ
jgi:hypothetical protein